MALIYARGNIYLQIISKQKRADILSMPLQIVALRQVMRVLGLPATGRPDLCASLALQRGLSPAERAHGLAASALHAAPAKVRAAGSPQNSASVALRNRCAWCYSEAMKLPEQSKSAMTLCVPAAGPGAAAGRGTAGAALAAFVDPSPATHF